MFNPKLDIAAATAKFQAAGRVTISDFFDDSVAAALRRHFDSLPADAWRLLSRTNGEHGAHYELTAALPDIFGTEGLLEAMNAITGMELTGISSLVGYNYVPGSYLTPHTDRKADHRLAFVYHLTLDWNPKWGGLFNDLTNGERFAPAFNSLMIFNVEEGALLHEVTKVTADAGQPRFTVAGWFK